MRTLRSLALAAAVVVAAAACAPADSAPKASSADGTASSEAAASVEVVNIDFKPATLKVLRSTTVEWVSRDADVRHTVTSGRPATDGVPGVSQGKPSRPDGTFDGDLPDACASFQFTFDEAGTYAYFCEVHPSMVAEVVVE
jgi:plastocyanin